MSDLSHLRLRETASSVAYSYAGGGGGGAFKLPPRDRIPHAQKLREDFDSAVAEFVEKKQEPLGSAARGLTLVLRSDPGFPLRLESLDRPGSNIELLSVGEDEGATIAAVFVPFEKLPIFLKLLDEYEHAETRKGRPRNEPLVASIASARLAIAEDLWRDTLPFPGSDERLTWEVWLRSEDGAHEETHAQFSRDCVEAGLRPSPHFIRFPDRVVSAAYGTHVQITASLNLLVGIAELRKAKELASVYVRLAPRFQREYIDDFLAHVEFADEDSPAVCVLDTGVNGAHPLLAPALAATDMHAVDESWGTSDSSPDQHGTGMAGIALYGCLTEVLNRNGTLKLRHRLESAKVLPPPPGQNAPEVYGYVTEEGVSRAIISAPERNRVLCMAITTDDRDRGVPSAWSGSIDQMCAGVLDEIPKLMFVSAGNVRDLRDDALPYTYPSTNLTDAGVEDPGQAWNVITVGAYTEKVMIAQDDFYGWRPIGMTGDLCPSSRTSAAWGEDSFAGWPIKPDVVMEGGNYATNGTSRDTPEDLSLLTTRVGADGGLFQCTGDTSPATADAARLAATLWSHYPRLWPETIRALVVHSARWSPAMIQRFPGEKKSSAHDRLRCYGFGVPSLNRAIYSAENAVTMIFEGAVQPYRLEGGQAKTNQMHLHSLPWPKEILESLGETSISMRVTLSYFIEPSPGRRGWTASKSHRYQSHGLRFDVIRLTESEADFRKRITRSEWDDPKKRPGITSEETRNWVVGVDGRTNGSVHSDWWNGMAIELAACSQIAVYPVTGWWKERPHKDRVESEARYSLIVSIEAPDVDVDLYTAIANQVQVETELEG
jgi:hypothetical protein